MMTAPLTLISLAVAAGISGQATAQDSKGEILVLLSSENVMQLADGKTEPTGYYLNEFGVPAKALTEAGYTLVLATPKGNAPAVDKKSVIPQNFDGNPDTMHRIEQFVASLDGIDDTLSLQQVIDAGLDEYEGVFIPGGHAPLIDLANNPEVRTILRHFHDAGKPTAAICHGPIALLSAQQQPQQYVADLQAGRQASASDWIYDGYQMTIFSTPEEEYFESTLDNAILLYYPADAMNTAGGKMDYADMWQPHVMVVKELITGQNPFSDDLLADKLLELLDQQAD